MAELPSLARKFLRIGLLERKRAKISVLLNLATSSFVTRPILCVGATMKTPQPAAYNHKNLAHKEYIAMLNRHRKLRMEQMEARQMMAGDVMARVVDGNLILDEAIGQAGRDNSVMISQVAPGTVRVAGGTLADGTMSKINGAASQDFTVPGNLVVRLGGGNDSFSCSGVAPPTFNDVNIDVAATAGFINSPDKDNVHLSYATIKGSVTVNTGADNDQVGMVGSSIAGNVSINTGAGADNVYLQNLTGTVGGAVDIQTFSSLAEKDADNVSLISDNVFGNINVRTGDGSDFFLIYNVTSHRDFNLDAGAGGDSLQLINVAALDNFFANLGDGNDNFSASNLFVNGVTKIDGGTGYDQLGTKDAFPTHAVKTNFESINGVPQGLTVNPNIPLNTNIYSVQ